MEEGLVKFLAMHPLTDVRIAASSLPYDHICKGEFRVRITMTETCTDEKRGYVSYDGFKSITRWFVTDHIREVGWMSVLEAMRDELV